jgi:hypothetical protein
MWVCRVGGMFVDSGYLTGSWGLGGLRGAQSPVRGEFHLLADAVIIYRGCRGGGGGGGGRFHACAASICLCVFVCVSFDSISGVALALRVLIASFEFALATSGFVSPFVPIDELNHFVSAFRWL